MFKLNHKGIGLPTALGIVAFVIALAASLLSYAIFQSQLIEKTIDRTEAYANAVQSVDATLKIIVRDQNLDPIYLSELEAYMGVTIEAYSTSVYSVTAMVSATKSVTSYITGSAASNSTLDVVFSKTGEEPGFVLSPLVTPTSLLSGYLPIFIDNTFPSLTPQTNFSSFQSIVDYIYSLTLTPGSYVRLLPTAITNQPNPIVSGHWYIDGNVTLPKNKSLTVPAGYLLFINGNLTMNENSVLSGNIVVNGNVTLIGKGNSIEELKGTFYIKGTLTTGKSVLLGTVSKPTFVLSEGTIRLGNNVSGYGYFLSPSFYGNQGNVLITGGVYASVVANLPPSGISPNLSLDESKFYDYAIPIEITTEGGTPGETPSFKYTFPKLN